MRSNFRRKLDDINLKLESLYRMHSYRKKAKVRLKRMNGGYSCDNEYKNVVIPYWNKYGYKPAKFWYQIFCENENKIDPRYIPDDLYYGKLVPYFSNSQFRRFGEDKCYHDVWFSSLKRPQTICKNIAGIFYNSNMEIINENQAIGLCTKFDNEFLIKPSIDSGEGRLIKFFSPRNLERNKLKEAFTEMKSNFIVQAVVVQHPELSKLNPTSLNTIRVVSFLFENEVHILSSILRMGASNARVDNVGAGGFACPIQTNGYLYEKGVNRKAEWKFENQNGIKFKGFKVPSFDKIISTIKDSHLKFAHFKLIGWDFAIDKDGEPVFIEYNVCPGQNQITCGPTFGYLTEEVLDEFFNKRAFENAQN